MNQSIKVLLLVVFLIGIISLFFSDFSVEGFTSDKAQWSQNTKNDFINLQQTINPGIVFDTNIIQDQVSETDAKYFLKNSMWKWSDETQQQYLDAVLKNPYIRNLPQDSLNHAMSIYNEPAILQVLFMQSTKEQELPTSKQHSDEDTYRFNSGLIPEYEYNNNTF